MADPAGVRIVEIRAGNSQRPVLELRPGVAVQPMSIGRVGMWPVDAPGVLDVHVYVYFDGRTLFLQSADPNNPAKGNGQAISGSWQQVEIPCTIEIGRARLVYRTLEEEADEEDKTVAQPIQLPPQALPPQQQFRPGAGTFSNRQQPDDESTRLAPMSREPDPTVVSPLEMGHGGVPVPVPKARPAAGMPANFTPGDGVPISATTIGPAPAPPPPQTGYQAFGSVQVAVPAPPPAPNAGMMQQQQPMMMQGFGQQPQMMQGMPMQQGMQPMMQPGMQPGMMQMQPGMMQMQPGMQPGASGPQMMVGSGPYPQQMMGPGAGADTSRLQPPGELTGFAKVKAEWNAMPPLRKLIVGTFPGVALLVYFMLFDDAPPPPPPPKKPVASASVSASSTPPVTASVAVSATAPTATNIATNATTATTTAPTNTATAPTATAPTAFTSATVAPLPSSSAPLLPKGKKTPEREAIDLATAGQYQKAAELYEQLAAQHPDHPAYREAARLLRQRVNPP